VTSSTPNQGFSFATVADPPCAWPAAMASLAGQVDAKLAAYTVDLAKLGNPPAAKISATNITTSINPIAYDTLELGGGAFTLDRTATSLTLPPGYWLVGGELTVANQSTGNVITVSGQIGGVIVGANSPSVQFQDFGWSANLCLAGSTGTGNSAQWSDLQRVTTSVAVQQFWSSALVSALTFEYVALLAVWIGDL
jgi:hypothetical protein